MVSLGQQVIIDFGVITAAHIIDGEGFGLQGVTISDFGPQTPQNAIFLNMNRNSLPRLRDFRDFSLSTLHYLLSSCTYGGCMEDDMDMATLDTFLRIVMPEAITADEETVEVALDPDGVYHTGQTADHEDLMK